jgi:hypothetical protein
VLSVSFGGENQKPQDTGSVAHNEVLARIFVPWVGKATSRPLLPSRTLVVFLLHLLVACEFVVLLADEVCVAGGPQLLAAFLGE